MSMESHIKRLMNAHRALDETIMNMMTCGHFDDDDLAEKKRQRLRLKDEIYRLQHLEQFHPEILHHAMQKH